MQIKKYDIKLAHSIPIGIYTSPEKSSIGKTEKELTDEKDPCKNRIA